MPYLLASYGTNVKKETGNMSELDTKLAIMPILSILFVREKPERHHFLCLACQVNRTHVMRLHETLCSRHLLT